MARTSLSCLVAETWPKAFVPTPVFSNKDPVAEACLDMLDFLSPWSGPDFPILCPRLVRKDLLRPALLTKPTPAPELVWTYHNFSAPGRDLTFLFGVQDLVESFCPHTRFQKQRSRCRSLLGHVRFSYTMVRTSLSRLVSTFCAKRFAPTDILEKTNTGAGACLDMSQFLSP